MIKAEIVLDSINVTTGDRLTTFAIRVPKFLLGQLARHRALSLNASSARAVPCKKIRALVLKDPFVPIQWGQNGKGMQAHGTLPLWKSQIAKSLWLLARYPAVFFHWLLADVLGVHKEVSNRILEPWLWAEVVVTATEWKNFFALRCDDAAQPEFRAVACQMRSLLWESQPQELHPGEYHLPFVGWEEGDYDLELQKKISAARCARSSYYLPEGGFSTPERDIELCDRLISSSHLSPLEHVCVALCDRTRSGNLVAWKQMRKFLPNEANSDYLILNCESP